jgi:phage-related protein
VAVYEGAYVLHAFQKKTQKTSNVDLELAQDRYTLIRGKP